MPSFEFFTMDAHLEGDKIVGQATGAWAEILQPFLDQFLGKLNTLKVLAKRQGGNVYNLYNPPHPTPAGMRFLSRKLKMTLAKQAFPVTANLAITHRCQCQCIHCSADPFRNPKREEVTVEEIKTVVDGALGLGASLVIYVGGEPLLRKEIYDLIKHVDKSKAVVMIFTNGLLLTQENVKRLADAGLYSLNISIDSVMPELHNRFRKVPGCYEKAFEGAARAREVGILTGVSTYATANCLREGHLEALLDKAVKDGFHEVTIFDCIPSGKFLKDTSKMLTPEDKKKVIEIGQRCHDDRSHSLGVNIMARINSAEGEGCYGASSQFYMTAYGDINPCDFNPVSFGNVREMPIEAIWQKMISHPDFCYRHPQCRMQTPAYRKKYIDPLPDNPQLPVSIEEIDAMSAARVK